MTRIAPLVSVLLLLLSALFLPADRAVAQGVSVTEIRVDGAQRIEPDTVRSYMQMKIGDPISAVALDRALKNLFATGLFADVTVRREGSAVVVRVVENPIINRIAFEGNQRVSDEILRDEVQLRPRVVYTRSRVQADVQRIIDIYRQGGRFAATVVPKVIQLPQNRVDLVFEVDEGDLTEIRKITFIGNRKFSDSSLRGVIQTKESAWWRFFSGGDSYDPDRLVFDRELLRRHYLANGYADFRVVSAVAELTPDSSAFFITFTVEEGERYRFGKVDIDTSLRDLKPDQLLAQLTVGEGDWYDADEVENSIGNLSDAAGSFGYAFVDVRPRVKRDREKRSIDVTFNVQEGPRVFVERINIVGNIRTEDKVIRREILLVEGDAFNTSKLRRTQRRIRNLGFFEKADVTNVPGSEADKTVVNVNLEEQSTGEISFGAGFSTQAGILGNITVRERNLVGRGQDLRVGLSVGQREQQIDLSFTEPYFLDKNLSAGFDIFRTSTDLQDESSFDRESLGFGLRAGYRITEPLTQTWRYTIRQDDITDVDPNASLAIQEQAGKKLTSSVGQILQYDKRDSRFEPTEGYLLRYTNEFAGIGGDIRFVKNEVDASYYYPITPEVVGSISVGAGYMSGIGQDTRIIDRFFLGGTNFRGFANSGAGPRDVGTDDSLGGNWLYRGTAEVTFPIGLPNELGIKMRVFTDVGSVGDSESIQAGATDNGALRLTVGIGLGWRSPFGPINIDFGEALLSEEFDDKQIFRFNFGARF